MVSLPEISFGKTNESIEGKTKIKKITNKINLKGVTLSNKSSKEMIIKITGQNFQTVTQISEGKNPKLFNKKIIPNPNNRMAVKDPLKLNIFLKSFFNFSGFKNIFFKGF